MGTVEDMVASTAALGRALGCSMEVIDGSVVCNGESISLSARGTVDSPTTLRHGFMTQVPRFLPSWGSDRCRGGNNAVT